MGKHMDVRVRRDTILTAAVRLAEKKGYTRITREEIATEADCSPALVSEMFGTMPRLRRCIQRAAVTNEVLAVIAQGLAVKDPHAMAAPDHVKAAVGKYLSELQ